ncbi:uncharacterized protein NP_5238A [Natronomonas pharaonis DSM 2160]|uniref:Uncharacterized protein n=1 Tax=Natronomonas pharaonis (strain ATCC 35678 / DSM 2160 / CIP 103997 / JCM 8858 / NBRC 14720 / NCIMB 2260 / Gabara) TaxID=348780 RepID=A0A1U7EZI6_NATPD|nr:hypothetical protein [Natronomonas pharaonis]CAI50710.1 uncharacterized protein NP_5238A [Natronomonas pharaonis DSM 2160]
MTNENVDPMVPVMPTEETTPDVRADGGRRKRYDNAEVDAPLVPDCQ